MISGKNCHNRDTFNGPSKKVIRFHMMFYKPWFHSQIFLEIKYMKK